MTLTPGAKGAATAAGALGGADPLAKKDKESVDLFPIRPGKDVAEYFLRFVGGSRRKDPEAIADSMHMGIHTDSILLKGFDEHQIGGFASYPR